MSAIADRQVRDQCRVVAHLARVICEIYERRSSTDTPTILLGIVGRESAALMEALGDICNEMDACDTRADAWVDPIYERARKMFPRGRPAK